MKIRFTLVLAANALGQEGQVSVCDLRETGWTPHDTWWSLLFLAVAVSAFLGWRTLENRLRERTGTFPWPSWQRWVPEGMVLSGGLVIATATTGLVEDAVAMAGVSVWALFNLPALILLGLIAGPFESRGPLFLLLPGATLVWAQWYGIVRWLEVRACRPRYLSIR